jgi:hypothetical protein
MVFVKGWDPAMRVRTLSKGDRIHVLGIPRVNLSEVAEMSTAKPTQTPLP